ncbi:MAG: YdcF family protein, partial [Deltaproteobacteria bacterium]|nr:YdcF family protein [Deltaproteobacteria bacterium]
VKPDGYEILERRGVTYPESRELMISLLKGLGVPESSILTGDIPSENTLMEANHVKNLVKEKKYGSLLLVTSPIHSRRVWLTFRKAMSGQDVRITVIPSSYSSFNPETWWKNPRYLREVLVEYQKLIYFFFKGFI